MNDKQRKEMGKGILDAACSLDDAIHDAGGSIRLSALREMKVEDLLVNIAGPNGIRFHVKGQTWVS